MKIGNKNHRQEDMNMFAITCLTKDLYTNEIRKNMLNDSNKKRV